MDQGGPRASLVDRVIAAEHLRRARDHVVDVLTSECLAEHPGFLDPAEVLALDLRSHLGNLVDLLAGAIAAGSRTAFADSARWTFRVLRARRFSPEILARCLSVLPQAIAECTNRATQSLTDEAIATALHAARKPLEAAVVPPLAPPAARFARATLAGDTRAAVTVARDALRTGTTLVEVYSEVVAPALVQIGCRWEVNDATAAEEHLAATTARRVLALLSAETPRPPPRAGVAIVATVAGELHDLGAQMVADAWALEGWAAHFLGSDLPADAFVSAQRAHGAVVLGISLTTLLHAPSAARLVATLRNRLGREVRILAGGAAFAAVPSFAFELGTDGEATDLRGAVALLRRLA